MRKLIKVDNLNNEMIDSFCNYTIQPGMSCGSHYHANNRHKFIGENVKEVNQLIYIIEKLNIANIEKLNDISFIFEAINRKAQKFLFKLCRYTRTDITRKILNSSEDAIKKGVQSYNALLLGHYTLPLNGGGYYINNMDIVPVSIYTSPRMGYNNLEDFKKRFTSSGNINSVYKVNRKINLTKVRELIDSKEFINAEKLIIK